MPKKPPLTIVQPTGTGHDWPLPPRHLDAPGRAVFDSIMRDYAVTDVVGIEILTIACEALDRAESLRATIMRDGEMLKTRNGTKPHSLLRSELANRMFYIRTLARLDLDTEPARPNPGRPGRGIGWIPDDD
jgi:hypothetical protein